MARIDSNPYWSTIAIYNSICWEFPSGLTASFIVLASKSRLLEGAGANICSIIPRDERSYLVFVEIFLTFRAELLLSVEARITS